MEHERGPRREPLCRTLALRDEPRRPREPLRRVESARWRKLPSEDERRRELRDRRRAMACGSLRGAALAILLAATMRGGTPGAMMALNYTRRTEILRAFFEKAHVTRNCPSKQPLSHGTSVKNTHLTRKTCVSTTYVTRNRLRPNGRHTQPFEAKRTSHEPPWAQLTSNETA